MKMGSYKICMCFTRKFRVIEADAPADVKEAFRTYAEGGSQMSSEQLRRFMAEAQGETEATVADAETIVREIIQKHHPIVKFTRRALTLEDFHHYLFSTDLNPPITSKVNHDMSAPLSHYFIFTGHNSYLTGNQLTSDCSDVPIIKALEKGVRVIELDIWPNSDGDDIDVLHGGTMTSPVELIRCLKSIKEHAFSASPYPVIITLEDHLTPELQAKVAQMLCETFGDMLFVPETECLKEFPSPEELKHRILISTKPPKEYRHARYSNHGQHSSQKSKDSDDVWGTELSSFKADQEENEKSDSDKSNEDEDDSFDVAYLVSAYKRLIAIPSGSAKGGLKEALKIESDKVRRLSLSEKALEKAAEAHGTELLRFTQRNILRVYPKGTRIDSSNYNPLIGWMHGAQMVAFNMQGYGRALWLMQGMFRSNGGCGYVKKPDFLMNVGDNNEVLYPEENTNPEKTLKVKVYIGDGWHLDFKKTHFDKFSPPDFYTRVGIAGVPADEIMKKTKTKEDNWTPSWDEEFTFPLTVPELALLRIEVHEYNISDEFAGQICIPVSELKPGIRAVPLCDRKGEKYNSVRLLMRFEFE